MKKQWKLDNKGMTLLEVIVAFAIFAIAATILITGFNGALKVMGNSEAIKDASQKNVSGLDVSGTTFEQMEGLKDITSVTKDENTVLTFDGYKISGTLITATTAKANDKIDMSLKMFEPDTEALVTPTVPTPEPTTPTPPPINPDDWIHLNGESGGKLGEAGSGDDKPFYSYIDGKTNPGNHGLKIKNNTKGDVYIYVKANSTLSLNKQEEPAYPPNIFIILENNTSKVELGKFDKNYSFFVLGRNKNSLGEITIEKKEPVNLKGNITNVRYNTNEVIISEKIDQPEIPKYVWDSIGKL